MALFLTIIFASLTNTRWLPPQRSTLKIAPTTHSADPMLMYYYIFPTLLVHYLPLVVKEVLTTFPRGITLATANYQVQKILPFYPLLL